MTIDILILVIFAGLVFLGWRSGALRQAIRVFALAAVVVAGPFVAQVLREAWFQETSVGSPVSEAGLLFCAGLLIYFGVSVAGWLAIKVMRAASDTLGNLDRLGGASVGATKAAVAIYLMVFVALFFEGPLTTADPDDRLHMRDGQTTEFVKQHNVLAPWHLPELETFHQMVRVSQMAKDQGREDLIREDPIASDVLRDDSIVALLGDAKVIEAVESDYYHVTFSNDKVREVLNNREIWSRVEVVDWARLEGELDVSEESVTSADLNLSDVLQDVIARL